MFFLNIVFTRSHPHCIHQISFAFLLYLITHISIVFIHSHRHCIYCSHPHCIYPHTSTLYLISHISILFIYSNRHCIYPFASTLYSSTHIHIVFIHTHPHCIYPFILISLIIYVHYITNLLYFLSIYLHSITNTIIINKYSGYVLSLISGIFWFSSVLLSFLAMFITKHTSYRLLTSICYYRLNIYCYT